MRKQRRNKSMNFKIYFLNNAKTCFKKPPRHKNCLYKTIYTLNSCILYKKVIRKIKQEKMHETIKSQEKYQN